MHLSFTDAPFTWHQLLFISVELSVNTNHYRPQACVKNSVHRRGGVCPIACWDTTPLARQTPWQGRPPWQGDPPGKADPPWQGDPPGKETPPWQGRPPLTRQIPPLCSACWEIRSTSGRYASYWNAILLIFSSLTTLWAKIWKTEKGFNVAVSLIFRCDISCAVHIQSLVWTMLSSVNSNTFLYKCKKFLALFIALLSGTLCYISVDKQWPKLSCTVASNHLKRNQSSLIVFAKCQTFKLQDIMYDPISLVLCLHW